MREVNSTSPRYIGTNSTKASIQKLLETSFLSFLLTTDAFSRTVRCANLVFSPNKRENDVFFSTGTSIIDALCKAQEGAVPSRLRKKVSKVTQVRISERLDGKVKLLWRLLRKCDISRCNNLIK